MKRYEPLEADAPAKARNSFHGRYSCRNAGQLLYPASLLLRFYRFCLPPDHSDQPEGAQLSFEMAAGIGYPDFPVFLRVRKGYGKKKGNRGATGNSHFRARNIPGQNSRKPGCQAGSCQVSGGADSSKTEPWLGPG